MLKVQFLSCVTQRLSFELTVFLNDDIQIMNIQFLNILKG